MQTSQNRLFVAYKPPFVSSNRFLNRLRYKYGKVPHAGFSGTLDPFAKGVLVVAFGQFTKLFAYLQKAPKTYRGTLWLGASSDTLDIDTKEVIADQVEQTSKELIRSEMTKLTGKIEQIPPRYSALRIGGTRAYKLARSGTEFELAKREATIYRFELISYMHPFVTFEATVSEGTYIRTLAYDLAQNMGYDGILSSLERVSEGKFEYQDEKPLNPLDFVDLPRNVVDCSDYELSFGKRLTIDELDIKTDGVYIVEREQFFVILEVEKSKVKYKLGKIDK